MEDEGYTGYALAHLIEAQRYKPESLDGIFHLLSPSSRTMALGSNQPLTETSTRNISWQVQAAGA